MTGLAFVAHSTPSLFPNVALPFDACQFRSQPADLHLFGIEALATGDTRQPAFPLRLDPIEEGLLGNANLACRRRYTLARLYQSHRLSLKLQGVARSHGALVFCHPCSFLVSQQGIRFTGASSASIHSALRSLHPSRYA